MAWNVKWRWNPRFEIFIPTKWQVQDFFRKFCKIFFLLESIWLATWMKVKSAKWLPNGNPGSEICYSDASTLESQCHANFPMIMMRISSASGFDQRWTPSRSGCLLISLLVQRSSDLEVDLIWPQFFFSSDLHEIWYGGESLCALHENVSFFQIQGQGHGTPEGKKLAILKIYLARYLGSDPWTKYWNVIEISIQNFSRNRFKWPRSRHHLDHENLFRPIFMKFHDQKIHDTDVVGEELFMKTYCFPDPRSRSRSRSQASGKVRNRPFRNSFSSATRIRELHFGL